MSGQFANAPELIIGWLRTQYALRSDEVLSGVMVGAKVPPERDPFTAPLVVVRRVGGVAQWPVIDRPRLDLLHWHHTEHQAAELADITRGLVLFSLKGSVLSGHHTIYRVSEFSGPQRYPDPAGSAVDVVMFTAEVAIRIR